MGVLLLLHGASGGHEEHRSADRRPLACGNDFLRPCCAGHPERAGAPARLSAPARGMSLAVDTPAQRTISALWITTEGGEFGYVAGRFVARGITTFASKMSRWPVAGSYERTVTDPEVPGAVIMTGPSTFGSGYAQEE